MKFDCVVIIDCWSMQQHEIILEKENRSDDYKLYELNKCKRFYQDFKDNLRKFEFDNILHALYRNSDNGDLLNKVEIDYDMSTIPHRERWMYKTHPFSSQNLGEGLVNSLTNDMAVPDDIEKLTDGKKILVCGRSFGACVHGRPVGILPLLNLGYDVYISSKLVLREGYRVNSASKHPTDLDAEFLLSDDVVWTHHREVDEDGECRLVPDLFKAVAIHRDQLHVHDMLIEYQMKDDMYFI